MASYLDFDGKYDKNRRFVITNWLPEKFESFWDGQPITIPAGGMYECEHAIAHKLTKEIVDKAMFAKAHEDFKAAGGDSAYAQKMLERGEMALLNRDMRKPYEDKTIQEIRPGEENPIMARMREEIRKEEQDRLSNGTQLTHNTGATLAATQTYTPTSPSLGVMYRHIDPTGALAVGYEQPQAPEVAKKRGRPAKPKAEFPDANNGPETA